MTVHVLDTGAIFILLNRHRPQLRRTLDEANESASEAAPQVILTPAEDMNALSAAFPGVQVQWV